MYSSIISTLLLYQVLIFSISLIKALLYSCKEHNSLVGVLGCWRKGQNSTGHDKLDIVELYMGRFHCCWHRAEGIDLVEPIYFDKILYNPTYSIVS
jgi:hypothetical protein